MNTEELFHEAEMRYRKGMSWEEEQQLFRFLDMIDENAKSETSETIMNEIKSLKQMVCDINQSICDLRHEMKIDKLEQKLNEGCIEAISYTQNHIIESSNPKCKKIIYKISELDSYTSDTAEIGCSCKDSAFIWCVAKPQSVESVKERIKIANSDIQIKKDEESVSREMPNAEKEKYKDSIAQLET